MITNPTPTANSFSSRLLFWFSSRSYWLSPLYACGVFVTAVFLILRAKSQGEFFQLFRLPSLAIGALVLFSLLIIVLGFPARRHIHVSFDRITQLGFIWIFGPASAALVNGLSSLCYPLITYRSNKQTFWRALVGALHNAGVFCICIYASGKLYEYLGGTVPLTRMTAIELFRIFAVFLCMQVLNEVLIFVKILIFFGRFRSNFDFLALYLEFFATTIAVLFALIVNNTDAVIGCSFAVFLIVVIRGAKYLNQVAVELDKNKEELEQKVISRTAEIDAQRQTLKDLNCSLEAANLHKEELLLDLQKTAKELDRQCRQDSLTGLYNRRHADEYLRHEFERLRRKKGTLTVALLDIDFFKRVNDNFSHAIGDATLKAVATIISGQLRALDLVARIGGEEILICLPDTGIEDALIVCERVREAIQKFNWEDVAKGLQLTASLGVAQYREEMTVEQLIQLSDEKLYFAKNNGRNRVCS